MRFKTTKQHTEWWAKRKIDWNAHYLATANHPHRDFITAILAKMKWQSLLEVGCGPGANLVNIISKLKNKQIGGIDVSADAIALAKETFQGGYFKVCPVEDIMMSDNSVDVVLSDMTLIYTGKIDQAIKEIKRIARLYVVLCELHEENFLKSILFRIKTGYYAHNYRKLLAKHGFEDIMLVKLPLKAWDGEPQKTRGYIIIAKVPTR